MRSLFASFPHGWPGVGLLLLRLVVGTALVIHGWRATQHTTPSLSEWAIAALTIGPGLAVVIGCFASAVAALVSLGTFGVVCGWIPWIERSPIEPDASTIFFVSICLAIVVLGPGSLSVDARRRGRREVIIPRHAPRGSRKPTI